jgi:hypothetical protein
VWHISPEGFRELRYSCLLSVKACAELLGCSMSSVKAWDRGVSRVPWSVVKLLRVFRLGDLGALQPEWRGWSIGRAGLVSPEGYTYKRGDLSWWSLTCRQADAWRQDRQRQRAGCPALKGHGLARGRGAPVSEPPKVFVWAMGSAGESHRLALPWQAASLPNPLLLPQLSAPEAAAGTAPAGTPAASGPVLCCVVRWQGATVGLCLGTLYSFCNQIDFALIAPPRLTGGESPQSAFAGRSASRSVEGVS